MFCELRWKVYHYKFIYEALYLDVIECFSQIYEDSCRLLFVEVEVDSDIFD